jgi:hypothetical protein
MMGRGGLKDPAGQQRAVGFELLPDDNETELVQAAERRQVRAGEGSVRHVEAFRMGCVRTPILGRPSTPRAPALFMGPLCDESERGRGVD